MFDTPILYLIFNRPDLTEITFPSICKIKPKKLFIAADGPRTGNKYDELNCMIARQFVLSKIDWDCEVQTLFRDKNLGCGKAVSEAISWFFMDVDEGIIIEDDCLPDASFFSYCSELLLRHRENNNIYHINGSNHQFGIKRGYSDYYYSVYPHVWGWATWRRAWTYYDYNMHDFDTLSKSDLFQKYAPLELMKEVKHGNVNTWDVQWVYSVMKNFGTVITPNVNLVKNIGFNENATHTITSTPDFIRYSKDGNLYSPLKHPVKILMNNRADKFTALFVHKIFKPRILDLLLKKIMRYYFNQLLY
jgi:hypothetical protein